MGEEVGILNEQGDIGPSFNYTILTDEEKKKLYEEEQKKKLAEKEKNK